MINTTTAKRPLESADRFVSPFEPLESRTLLSTATPAFELHMSFPAPVAFHPQVVSSSAGHAASADSDDAPPTQSVMAKHVGLPTPENFGALSLGNASGRMLEQTTLIVIDGAGGVMVFTETHLIGSHQFGGGGFHHFGPGPGRLNPGVETPDYRDVGGTTATPADPPPLTGGSDDVAAPPVETPHSKKGGSSKQINDVVTAPASNASAATATNFTALSVASTPQQKSPAVRVRGGGTTAVATIDDSSFVAKAAKAARASISGTIFDSSDGTSRIKVPGGGAAAALFSSMLIRTGQTIAQAAAKAVADAPGAIAAEAAKLAGSWVADAATSIDRDFHFQQMGNPLVLIGDALAAFSEESAQAIRGQVAEASYVRAWGITATVVAIDAVALMYYWQTTKARRRRRGQQTAWASDAMVV